ncbi:MAG: phage holin family protein [Micrococcales bacterium]|nr:phage holin family protein [Micrococcales bacterium]
MAYTPGSNERTIGQLVVDITDDIKGIVRGEIQLAKAEVSGQAKIAGKGAGFLGAAAFLALLGLIFLFHAAARGIAEFLPVWAGYLIVAAVLLLLAAILGLMGKKSMTKVQPKPEKTIRNAQETVQAVKAGAASGTQPGLHVASRELPPTEHGQARAARAADDEVFGERG